MKTEAFTAERLTLVTEFDVTDYAARTAYVVSLKNPAFLKAGDVYQVDDQMRLVVYPGDGEPRVLDTTWYIHCGRRIPAADALANGQ
ncbi:hypothetical protein [Dactylosporangium sp. NPDC000521]|uniref:hypothetical protein n=1 Tax=Dactylosporangium sp. NPDC000521 TaxID=3363975 RepID=UPI0036A750F8